MSNRVKRRPRASSVALVGLVSCTALLSGCTSSRFFGPPLVTNSVNTAANADLNQPLPNAVNTSQLPAQGQPLSAASSRAPYVPAVGVGANSYPASSNSSYPQSTGQYAQGPALPDYRQPAAPQPQIVRQELPQLSSPNVTSTQTMPAMPDVAEVNPTQAPLIDETTTASISKPRIVPNNAFIHKIEAGESLYAIARHYDVTTDAIIATNGLASPDKIYVGQELIIPGRPGMVAPKPQNLEPVKVAEAPAPVNVTPPAPIEPAAVPARIDTQTTASIKEKEATPVKQAPEMVAPTPIARPQGLKPAPVATPKPKAVETPKPVQTASVSTSVPKVETTPVADSFRWPVKGRVIADFKASKNTGLNIEVPEGSAVRAAEAGLVIYVGNAVEGFGNLILIRHASGYVSAYAHLKDITVAKGTNVARGESIGTVGMTGSVNRPQLHFELRKGATPVDPAPLLAG